MTDNDKTADTDALQTFAADPAPAAPEAAEPRAVPANEPDPFHGKGGAYVIDERGVKRKVSE